ATIAQRLRYRLAERDADVFHRVVLIDIEIALGVERQIERAVPREQLQHVIEEADAGADLIPAAAFNRQLQADLRFFGLALNYASAHKTSSSAAMHVL